MIDAAALGMLLVSLLKDPTAYAVAMLTIFGGVIDLLGTFVLIVVGILVIVLIVGLAIVLLPAILVAIVVWFFTGSFLIAGIAFLVVALISLVAI